jgi:2-oxoglutarate ferredoxin oxidoreductase subunit gamma
MRIEIRFAGFGGQGIIKAGIITAAAACLYDGKYAVQTQSYGPESRGSVCRSDVVISEEEIDFPKVTEPDILVLMSQHAYDEYAKTVKKGGIVILDSDMVHDKGGIENIRILRVPAMKIAERIGKKIVANMVMLGVLAAITGVISKEAFKKSIKANFPKEAEELNLKAFEAGYEYGRKLL